MSSQAISAAIQQLKQEHIRLCKELEHVDQALNTLGSLEGSAPVKFGKGKKAANAKPKRRISAAARKKMSEAAKARWAAARTKETGKKS